MPTTLYTKNESGSVGHAGKEYHIKNGAVEVPDEAVPALVESHGFSKIPHSGIAQSSDGEEGGEEGIPKDTDYTTLSREKLIAYGNQHYALELTPRTSKADALESIEGAIEFAEEAAKNQTEKA